MVIGAAPEAKIRQRSRPRAIRTFLKTKAFAKPHDKGKERLQDSTKAQQINVNQLYSKAIIREYI